MKIKCTAFAIFFICILNTVSLAAQDSTADYTPEPYGVDEFSLWQKELRRFEILSFGAMPFVALLTFWGYDIVRSIQHPGDPNYYPWPLGNAGQVPLTMNEQKNLFFSVVGISVGIAAFDIVYRAIRREVRLKKLERENEIREEPIQLLETRTEKAE